ncbi:hypothetical protein PR048_030989 [Dryococelus australis]|uniref:Uncharacterized protein n=1 Tax=Dryococelus australis TaxID=614101 RepID=A0ABQ9G852_9NEOP|nr:hypothetical protein PR048_030989 [Dryococelus australis]
MGGEKWEILEKTTCENTGVTPPMIELGSPRWEESTRDHVIITKCIGSPVLPCPVQTVGHRQVMSAKSYYTTRTHSCYFTHHFHCRRGRGRLVGRLLASHFAELSSIPGGSLPGFSHVEIVPDDAVCWRVFSGISRSPVPSILELLHTHLTSPSSALKTLLSKATHSITFSRFYYKWEAVAQWLGRSPPTKGDPSLILGGFAPGFSHVGIVLDDVACRRVFSGYSRFPRPCLRALLHPRVSYHVMSGDDGHLRVPAGKPFTRPAPSPYKLYSWFPPSISSLRLAQSVATWILYVPALEAARLACQCAGVVLWCSCMLTMSSVEEALLLVAAIEDDDIRARSGVVVELYADNVVSLRSITASCCNRR